MKFKEIIIKGQSIKFPYNTTNKQIRIALSDIYPEVEFATLKYNSEDKLEFILND